MFNKGDNTMIRLKKTKNGFINELFFLDTSPEKALFAYGDEGYQILNWDTMEIIQQEKHK